MKHKLIYVIIAVFLVGCGAIKREVSKVEVRKKVDSFSVTFKGIDLKRIHRDLIFIPTLTDKPIIIKGDTIYNARVEYRNRKIDSIVIEKDTIYVTKEVIKKEKQVETKREAFNWWGLAVCFFLVVVVIVVGNRR